MRTFGVLLFATLFPSFFPTATAAPTSLSCTTGAVPTLVRAEGLTEAMGDILLNCTGTPGGTTSGNLTVILNVNITNRLSSTTNTVNATLTADTGGSVQATPVSPNSVVFSGLNFTVSPSGTLTLRISNLRGAVHQLTGAVQLGQLGPSVQAFLAASSSTGFSVTNSTVTVATALTGLLANFSSSFQCGVSPLPATISLSNLFATGTRFNSTRITEGFPSSFQKRGTGDDSGTRILARFDGLPAGARLFVPDAIAGSDALAPTAGGDLGVAQSGGQYAPSAGGSLLLLRVTGADSNGAGGSTVLPTGFNASGVSTFDSASEVQVQNGTGIAVYEVVDSNASVRETAQFPTFLGLAQVPQSAVATEQVSLAPVSAVTTATATDPIPRFAATQPPSDCSAIGDCSAPYFPQLSVLTPSLQFTAQAGGQTPEQYVQMQNTGGGGFTWTASVAYTTGAGWLVLSQYPGRLRVDTMLKGLSPGTYRAVITINAGSAGSGTVPVSLQVNAAPPSPPAPTPQQPAVTVTGVTNAASFASGALVPGSLATIKGLKLSGNIVAITFDGLPAKLLYVSDQQINLQVPPDLGAKTTAQMVVTVDGAASLPQTVSLAAIAPGIFTPGILNEDNSVNGPNSPAAAGSIVQIFGTGLGTGTNVTARFGTGNSLPVYYGGPAPGLIGVQQVDVLVPATLGSGATDVQVCGANGGAAVCSPAVKVYLQ